MYEVTVKPHPQVVCRQLHSVWRDITALLLLVMAREGAAFLQMSLCPRTSHISTVSANMASEQAVKIVKMKNEMTSIEIPCFFLFSPHIWFIILICTAIIWFFNASSQLYFHNCTHCSSSCPILPLLCTAAFSLHVWVLLSFSEASNLLSIFLPFQTSLLDRFQLSTFDIILSSSFPASS